MREAPRHGSVGNRHASTPGNVASIRTDLETPRFVTEDATTATGVTNLDRRVVRPPTAALQLHEQTSVPQHGITPVLTHRSSTSARTRDQ